jgi:hypothetical protein
MTKVSFAGKIIMRTTLDDRNHVARVGIPYPAILW